ncbi:hypothetical protein [Paraburkholderia pallida]|uniref:Uncharacterized protein n=1 Tax=Paraburkholderia pallida TaxID=2547399 RepID=A0A4P7CVE3_9BURK|nr:hypothetical protein [Paraburkholderia pallida]QBQ98169.1 hypothetical protein E1956_13955 [Paraburkholderia pallida]
MDNKIQFTFGAQDAGLKAMAASVASALTGIRKQSDDAAASVANQGKASKSAAEAWAIQRREIELLYTSMGKMPSKQVEQELDELEKKFLSMGVAAERGSKIAADGMRKLLSEAKAMAAADAGTERRGAMASVTDQVVGRSAGILKAAIGGIAAAFTLAAIKRRVMEQYELADAMGKSAEKAGVSVAAISTLSYASKFAGVESDALTASLGKLGKTMVDVETGGKKSAAVFQVLGVSATEQSGKLRAADQVLLDIAERFSNMPDGVAKTTLAMDLFGKSGAELIPFLNGGKEGIAALQEEARKLGLELSDNDVVASAQFNDNLERLHARAQGMWRLLAMQLVPTLDRVADTMVKSGGAASDFQVFISGVDYSIRGLVTAGSTAIAVLRQFSDLAAGVLSAGYLAMRGEGRAAAAALKLAWDDSRKDGQAWAADMNKLWGAAQTAPAPTKRGGAPVDLAPIAAASAGDKSHVAEWENELNQQKLAHERINAENSTFIEFSKERERDFWKTKLDTVKMSNEERYSVEQKYLNAVQAINKEAFEAGIAQQKAQMAALEKNYAERVKLAGDIADRMRAAYGADSKQYADAQRAQLQEEHAFSAQKRALSDLDVANRRSALASDIELQRQQGQLSLSLGLITRAQLLEQELGYQQQLYEIDRQALEERAALVDPQRDPELKKQLDNKLLEQERAYQLQKKKLQADLTVEKSSSGLNAFTSMETQLGTALTGMLTRTQSWRKSMQGLFTSVGGAFVDELVSKPLAKYAAGLARQLVLGQAASTAETTLATTTAAQKIATSSSAAMVQGSNNAVVAGTGAASALASIPIVGPALAAAGMPAMIALVMGTLGTIHSASGGFDIPAGMNPLTQLHEQEMVLPAKYANVIRSIAANGSSDSPQAVFAPVLNVHAVDQRSMERMLRRNDNALMTALQGAHRKFMTKRP